MYRSIITFVICFIFQAICAQTVVEKDFVVQNGEISLPGNIDLEVTKAIAKFCKEF